MLSLYIFLREVCLLFNFWMIKFTIMFFFWKVNTLPSKIYNLRKTNIFFSRFEGTRGEKNQIFRTKDARDLAQLLRGTFYILSKQQDLAMSDLGVLIEDDSANSKIRANALIKRASLFIQQCKDPVQDPLKVRLT